MSYRRHRIPIAACIFIAGLWAVMLWMIAENVLALVRWVVGCEGPSVASKLSHLSRCGILSTAVRKSVSLVKATALTLMRLAEKASGPRRFRTLALEVHGGS